MNANDRYELAWAAGLFDGEGSVGVYGTNSIRLSIHQAGNDRPEVLERFTRAVGAGKISGPYKLPGRTPIWQMFVHRHEGAQYIAALLWPWLSSVKRAQIAKALRKFVSAYRRRRASLACQNGHLRAEHGRKNNRGHWICRVCFAASMRRQRARRVAC